MTGLKALNEVAGQILKGMRFPASLRAFGKSESGTCDFTDADHIYSGPTAAIDDETWPKCLGHELGIANIPVPPPCRCMRRQVVLADVSLLLAATLTAGVWVRLAGEFNSREARNPAADALAERFASPAPPTPDMPSRDAVARPEIAPPRANAEERLNFAPGLALETAGLLRLGQDLAASAEVGPESAAPAVYDSLSVLIIRNLPQGASFSVGAPVAGGAWVMAEADLDKLVLTLPAGLDKPVKAEIETIAADGVSAGAMSVELRSEEKPSAALKRSVVSTHAKPVKPQIAHKKVLKRLETAQAPQRRLNKQAQAALAVKQPQPATAKANAADDKDTAAKSPGVLTQILTKLGLMPAEPTKAAIAPEEGK